MASTIQISDELTEYRSWVGGRPPARFAGMLLAKAPPPMLGTLMVDVSGGGLLFSYQLSRNEVTSFSGNRAARINDWIGKSDMIGVRVDAGTFLFLSGFPRIIPHLAASDLSDPSIAVNRMSKRPPRAYA